MSIEKPGHPTIFAGWQEFKEHSLPPDIPQVAIESLFRAYVSGSVISLISVDVGHMTPQAAIAECGELTGNDELAHCVRSMEQRESWNPETQSYDVFPKGWHTAETLTDEPLYYTTSIQGIDKLTQVIASLIELSQWFQVEPKSDDLWHITLKAETINLFKNKCRE